MSEKRSKPYRCLFRCTSLQARPIFPNASSTQTLPAPSPSSSASRLFISLTNAPQADCRPTATHTLGLVSCTQRTCPHLRAQVRKEPAPFSVCRKKEGCLSSAIARRNRSERIRIKEGYARKRPCLRESLLEMQAAADEIAIQVEHALRRDKWRMPAGGVLEMGHISRGHAFWHGTRHPRVARTGGRSCATFPMRDRGGARAAFGPFCLENDVNQAAPERGTPPLAARHTD